MVRARPRTRSARAVPALEALEARQLFSASFSSVLQPEMFGDQTALLATVAGVTPATSNLSDLHAYIRYDTGKLVTAQIVRESNGTLDIRAIAPPAIPGVHTLELAFWQSTPGTNAVTNVLTTGSSVTIDGESTNGNTETAFVGQSLGDLFLGYISPANLPITAVTDSNGVTEFSPAPGLKTVVTISIDWGDGHTSAGFFLPQGAGSTPGTPIVLDGPPRTIGGDHAYSAPGTYSVHVMTTATTGPDTGSTTPGDTTTVSLGDIHSTMVVTATTAAASAIPVHKGVATNFNLGRFGITVPSTFASGASGSNLSLGILRQQTEAPGSAPEYLVAIDWGDHSTSSAQLIANNTSGWDVTGNHTYAAAGTYSAHVYVLAVSSGTTPAATIFRQWTVPITVLAGASV